LDKFLEFDFEIQYKSRVQYIIVDASSRCFYAAWSSPTLDWLNNWKKT